ncbi:MAG: zinc ribbon domain-containing protein [Planctomycetota bacterium]
MPLYEYSCKAHGVFEALMPLSESSSTAQCPFCGQDAPRVMSIPFTRVLDSGTRKGMEVNERSKNEPYRLSDYAEAPPTPIKSEKIKQSSGARPWMMG